MTVSVEVRANERAEAQRALAEPIRGQGLELGAGHVAYPAPESVEIKYVDRLRANEARELFPEVEEEFVDPDIVVDLDTTGLDTFADDSQDFVIASHVIEHVADPIRLLRSMHRITRSGGHVVLVVPNREMTFDKTRQPTPNKHLDKEHRKGVRAVDDKHIREFMENTGQPPKEMKRRERKALIRAHRDRSIHAHCWNEPEFAQLLAHVSKKYDLSWDVVAFLPPDAYPGCFEFGYVLQPRKD